MQLEKECLGEVWKSNGIHRIINRAFLILRIFYFGGKALLSQYQNGKNSCLSTYS